MAVHGYRLWLKHLSLHGVKNAVPFGYDLHGKDKINE
jgi:hypothetical protein